MAVVLDMLVLLGAVFRLKDEIQEQDVNAKLFSVVFVEEQDVNAKLFSVVFVDELFHAITSH